jgi:hypothetical protein
VIIIVNNINADAFSCLMQQSQNRAIIKIYREYRPTKRQVAILLGLILVSIGIWGLLSSITGQMSYSQQTPPPTTDFFLLECDAIKDKVNELLNSKGSIQKNLIAIKEMIFLMDLYDIKCSTAS